MECPDAAGVGAFPTRRSSGAVQSKEAYGAVLHSAWYASPPTCARSVSKTARIPPLYKCGMCAPRRRAVRSKRSKPAAEAGSHPVGRPSAFRPFAQSASQSPIRLAHPAGFPAPPLRSTHRSDRPLSPSRCSTCLPDPGPAALRNESDQPPRAFRRALPPRTSVHPGPSVANSHPPTRATPVHRPVRFVKRSYIEAFHCSLTLFSGRLLGV